MPTTLFRGDTHIEIQGERVLRLVSLGENSADFEVIGFEDSKILITDYRPVTVSALRDAIEANAFDEVADWINLPADAHIQQKESGTILVELSASEAEDPPYRLWIPIGIGDSIPVYAYLIERIEPLDEDRYAFFALYYRDFQKAYELSDPSVGI